MAASKVEQVLHALRARLVTVPGAVVERNGLLPETIPAGGLIILRDGDPAGPPSKDRGRSATPSA